MMVDFSLPSAVLFSLSVNRMINLSLPPFSILKKANYYFSEINSIG